MPEAYLVTEGEYLDYRVLAVFSTRDGAEKYAVYHPGSVDIEPVEFDELEKYPLGKLRYSVLFDREGNNRQVKQEGPDDGYEEVQPYGDGKSMITYCWANDEHHAAKIANERWVRLIATNGWETDFQAWRKKQYG